MKDKILLIGAINIGGQPAGGEEYKNQLFLSILTEKYHVKPIDTFRWKSNWTVILKLFFYLFAQKWDLIIISASSVSAYRLIQFIQFFPWLSKNTMYFVVGGYLPTAISRGVFKIEPYEALKGLVVQGDKLREILRLAGYNGVIHVLPNFKYFPKTITPNPEKNEIFRFIFLSRINPDKGIKEIIEADRLLRSRGINNFTITMFGPLEKDFEHVFFSMLGEGIKYEGILDIMNQTENAYNTIASFDAMLFPTYWKGEGFPGVLVDAFAVGLPIIASDWNINSELVKNEYNGLLIPIKDAEALADAMKRLITEDSLRDKLSQGSRACANEYHADHVKPLFYQIIKS